MDVSQVTNPIQQLLISSINPQGSTTVSNPDATSNPIQGVQGFHHHHHKGMMDMISKMENTIDNAVGTGKLTDDQATQMKKELDSITQTLKQGQSSSSIQGAQGTPLTSDQIQQIRAEFQDVRKQLFDALNPQGSTSTPNAIDSLFKQMDTDGSGIVDENEFSTFINSLV